MITGSEPYTMGCIRCYYVSCLVRSSWRTSICTRSYERGSWVLQWLVQNGLVTQSRLYHVSVLSRQGRWVANCDLRTGCWHRAVKFCSLANLASNEFKQLSISMDDNEINFNDIIFHVSLAYQYKATLPFDKPLYAETWCICVWCLAPLCHPVANIFIDHLSYINRVCLQAGWMSSYHGQDLYPLAGWLTALI